MICSKKFMTTWKLRILFRFKNFPMKITTQKKLPGIPESFSTKKE